MRNVFMTLLGAAFLALAPVSANAVTITLTNLTTTGDTLDLGDIGDGLTLEIRGIGPGPQQLVSNGNGMGIFSTGNNNSGSPRDQAADEQVLIDGRRGDERLRFTFNRNVLIESVTYFLTGSDDDVDVLVGGNLFDRNTNLALGTTPIQTTQFYGNTFDFRATQNNDRFAIVALSVTEVPLPASAALLFGGVALLGAAGMRRRTRRAA